MRPRHSITVGAVGANPPLPLHCTAPSIHHPASQYQKPESDQPGKWGIALPCQLRVTPHIFPSTALTYTELNPLPSQPPNLPPHTRYPNLTLPYPTRTADPPLPPSPSVYRGAKLGSRVCVSFCLELKGRTRWIRHQGTTVRKSINPSITAHQSLPRSPVNSTTAPLRLSHRSSPSPSFW